MPIVSCKICKKKFYTKECYLKRGWGKYCSSKCQYEAQRKGKFVHCDICGKKIWRKPLQLKLSKSGKFFCNKSHHMAWKNKVLQVGENHPNWTGGEFAGRGILKRANRKIVCACCGNFDKRVMAVHHKDSNRKNNKITNLVWLCHNCHHLVHCYNLKIN